MNRAITLLLAFGLLAARVCLGQGPTTGTPPFGSFGGGPFDTVNLGNLNVHFSIPVVNKAGRGMPFTYALSYDSSVWVPGATGWSPTNNWGWHADTEVATGYVSYQYFSVKCNTTGGYDYKWLGFAYHDPFGTSHNILGYAELDDCDSGKNRNLDGPAMDGSGYTVSFYVDGSGTNQVTSRNGSVTVPPYGMSTGAGTVTDPNGNQITTDGNGNFYDTLSSTTPVLTVAGTSPKTFTYTGPSGGALYTMKYGSYNVKTSFGCTGVPVEYGPKVVPLVSSIVLPNTSAKYTFTYETSGGYYTGRLASVTLPTGGTISYTYTGANKGIVCADGSTLGLTRTTPDSSTAWTYSRTGSGTTWVTTIMDSQLNKTVINFSKDSSTTAPTNNFYETQRLAYQGSSTLLLTSYNCWNNNFSSCATQAVASPVTKLDHYFYPPGVSQAISQTVYNGNGLLTQDQEFDYGATSTPTKVTSISYANLGNGIVDRPACVQVTGGSVPTTCGALPLASDTVSLTNYLNYDHGNVGTIQRWVTGTTTPVYLTRTFTYTTTGGVNTIHDVNGAPTTYGYVAEGNCPVNSFPTSVTEPLSLSHSMTWDCNGGVLTSVTDESNNTVNYMYTDPYFWRLTEVDDPAGAGMTTTTYGTTSPPWTVTTCSTIDGNSACPAGSNSVTTLTKLDGLGRTMQKQLTSDLAGGTDYVDTTYDALGRLSSVSNPYHTTSDYTYGATSYSYDALSRLTNITNPDLTHRSMTYTSRAVQTTNERNIPVVYQYDALGRLGSACVGVNANQQANNDLPAACGQDIAVNGFLTTYGYSAIGNMTSVNYRSQTRQYQYDGLSRLTSETNPESGTTTYSFDHVGQQGDLYQRTRPAPNQNQGNTATTTYSFDLLHRLTGKSYSGGNAPPTVTFKYDVADSTWGVTQNNILGRLSSAWVGSTVSSAFSYDKMGRVLNQWQCTPNTHCNSTGSVNSIGQYDFVGDLTYVHVGNNDAVRYTYDTTPHITAIKDDNNSNVTYMYNVLYNGLELPRNENMGDSNAITLLYDQFGGLTSKSVVNGSTTTYSLGVSYTSDHNVLTANDSVNGNWSYAYSGAFPQRLGSSTCSLGCPNGTSTESHTYSYDEFANRWTQTAPNGGPNFIYTFNANNQIIAGANVVYDAAGNMTTDENQNTYTYDDENRLAAIGGPNYSTSYNFDAFGRRVELTNLTGYKDFFYDVAGRMSYQGGSQTPFSRVYFGSNPIATINSTGVYYYYGDHVATLRLNTNSTGTVVNTCTNLAFGDWLSCTNPTSTNDKADFTGQWTDPYGMASFPARSYSLGQGRWATTDPAGRVAANPGDPQTWNRYAYVTNNPLSFTDPLGLTDDCGGPCTPISYNLGPCTENVTYYQGLGDDGNTYDMPQFDLNCDVPMNSRGATSFIPPGKHGHSKPRPANNFTLGVRAPGQSWSNCMSANTNNYSMGGAAELTINVATGTSTSVSTSPVVSTFTGNGVSGLLFSEGTDAAQTGLTSAPDLINAGIGTVTTYGRNSTTITALNIARTGGAPQALSSASTGVSSFLESASSVFSLGMSAAYRWGVDVALTGAEAFGCSIPRGY
jgi:RHS repeat-associated protein